MTTFNDIVPPHDCVGTGCEHPGAVSILMVDHPDSVDVEIEAHRVDMKEVATALIGAFDTFCQRMAPDDVPLPIVYARSREFLMQAIETVPALPDTAAAMDSFIQSFIDSMSKGEEDD